MRHFTLITIFTLSLIASGVLHAEAGTKLDSRADKISSKEPARKISARRIPVSETPAPVITAPELIAKTAVPVEAKKEVIKAPAAKTVKAKPAKVLVKEEVVAEIKPETVDVAVEAAGVADAEEIVADEAAETVQEVAEGPAQIIAPDIEAKEVVAENTATNVVVGGSILDMMPPDERLAPLKAEIVNEVAVESTVANPADLLSTATEGTQIDWARYVVGLIFVGSLLIVTGLYLSKNGGKSILKTSNRSTRVVQTINLGLKRQLAVVDFEGSRLLIAIGATETTLIQVKDLKTNEVKKEEGLSPAPSPVTNKVNLESIFKPVALPVKPEAPFVDSKRAELTDQIRDKIKSLKKIHMGAQKPSFGSILGKNLADEPQGAVIDYDLNEGFKAPNAKSGFNQSI